MSITVIGFFSDRTNAKDAVDQLTRSGFNDGDIDVSHHTTADPADDHYVNGDHTADSAYSRDTDRDDEGNAITRFFNSLFGNDSHKAHRYSAMSQKATSIVTVHAAGTEQAEEAANILDASGAMDIDEGELIEHTHDDIIAGHADHQFQHRSNGQRLSTEVAGRSSRPYSEQTYQTSGPVTSRYTEPVDSEQMSEGLTEADLKEAGIDPADIVTAENAEAHFEIEHETAPGGIAPGVTGAPALGNLTTAQGNQTTFRTDQTVNSRDEQRNNRIKSRIIHGRVEDEHRLRADHTRVNKRDSDRLPE